MEMIGKAHKTKVLGTSMTWGEMGEGYPLVLLHGLYDSHRSWRRAAPFLASAFRVLMLDLPGHGYSGRPDASYTLSYHAKMVAAWMKAIGVEKAHICGHSFGGGIAQWMTLEQRRRVDRLALVSPGGLGREVAAGMRFASFPVLGRIIAPRVMKLGVPIVLKYAPEIFGGMEPEEKERFLEMCRIPGTDRAFQRTLAAVINFFGQYMQTIQRAGEVAEMPPVALFWGENDPFIPVRHGKNAVAHSKGITLTVYEGCGHYAHLEAPVRFASDLTQFLLDPTRQPARFLPRDRKSWMRSLFDSREG